MILKVGDIVKFKGGEYHYKIFKVDIFHNIVTSMQKIYPNVNVEPYEDRWNFDQFDLIRRSNTKDPRPSWF